jgi:hypothetical protein
MSKALSTVSVLVEVDGAILAQKSWADDKAGNEQAEAYFREQCEGQEATLLPGANGGFLPVFTPEEIADCIDDGVADDGDWTCRLIHSSTGETTMGRKRL